MVFSGKVVKGLGVASSFLHLQAEHLGLSDEFHRGTINLQLLRPLFIKRVTRRVKPVAWHPKHPTFVEGFDLLEVQFSWVRDGEKRPALIYLPDESPHRKNPFYVEVITSYWKPPRRILRPLRGFIHIPTDQVHKRYLYVVQALDAGVLSKAAQE